LRDCSNRYQSSNGCCRYYGEAKPFHGFSRDFDYQESDCGSSFDPFVNSGGRQQGHMPAPTIGLGQSTCQSDGWKRQGRSNEISSVGADFRVGSNSDLTALKCDFRYTLGSGHRSPDQSRPFSANNGLTHRSKQILNEARTERQHRPISVAASHATGGSKASNSTTVQVGAIESPPAMVQTAPRVP
jgi:hypothetical protein